MKIVKPSVTMLWATEDPENIIEKAGRTCYKSEQYITETSSRDFAIKMRKSGHEAMIEHAVASMLFITDRGITHEIVRHRIASYAQESTRYCNYSAAKFNKEITVIEPSNLTPLQRLMWIKSCEDSEDSYFRLLEMGQSPQIARSVLPTCLKTELVMTANFREWRHFIKLRMSKAAHPDIRPLAKQVLDILFPLASGIFGDLEFSEDNDVCQK